MLPHPKLVSVLIPSRWRFDKLQSTLQTFASQLTEDERKEVEFVFRFDTDDVDTIKRIPELPFSTFDLQVIVGSRYRGYRDGVRFMNEAARLSRGTFLFLWNDDALFKTANWFQEFKRIVTSEKSAYSYWFSGTFTNVYQPGQPPRYEEWPSAVAYHRLFYSLVGIPPNASSSDGFVYHTLFPLGLLKKIETISVDHKAWFDTPPEKRDALASDPQRLSMMVPDDPKVIEDARRKIVQYANQTRPPVQDA